MLFFINTFSSDATGCITFINTRFEQHVFRTFNKALVLWQFNKALSNLEVSITASHF